MMGYGADLPPLLVQGGYDLVQPLSSSAHLLSVWQENQYCVFVVFLRIRKTHTPKLFKCIQIC